jgi:hypothetical protein
MELFRKNKTKLLDHLLALEPERRKHRRIPLHLPTEYLTGEATRFRLCHTLNISEGGVLLCLSERAEVGQRLRIRIYYHFHSKINIFEAIGEVVWIGASKNPEKKYQCALEFVDLSLADLRGLKGFLGIIFC